MKHLPVLLALGLATGCASTLSTMQTAQPLAPGQVQVSGGLGFFLPLGQLTSVADLGIDLGREAKDAVDEDRPFDLREEDQRRLLTAGISLAVAPPGVSQELMVRVGVVEEVDVGVRYSGISLRVDGKVRLLHGGDPESVRAHHRTSYDLALGVGLARHFFESVALDVLEVVDLDNFSRYDVEVPLYLSMDYGDIFKLYGVPKYVYSRTQLDERLINYAALGKPVTGFDVSLPARVHSHFAGATLGVGLGYKYLHLYAELTGGYTFSKPHVFGERRNLGGVTLYPAVGFALRTGAPEASTRRRERGRLPR